MLFRHPYQWRITAMLFFATTINYLDRSVLSILAPGLQRMYGWTEIDYGHMVAAFQLAYGIGVLLAGKLLDKYGNRIVFAMSIGLWSLSGMGHALARGLMGFSTARFFLGLGEAANFPASVKTVAETFPKEERALVTGIFNAGSNIGAIAAPLLVPWLAIRYGWRWAFIVTGGLGLLWVAGWLKIYKPPVQREKVRQMSWGQLLKRKEVWLICIARFLTDPVWWFLLYWLPKFLDKRYHVGLGMLGLPLVVVYIAADLGSLGGGWLSSSLIKKGKAVARARSTAMFICALCALPLILMGQVSGLWSGVFLIGLAGAAHQGWAANIYTVMSDLFPGDAVASVVGISTCAAVVGSTLASTAIGWVLEWTGSYSMIFAVAGCLYLAAWSVIRVAIRNGK